jgi:hypothetical protein
MRQICDLFFDIGKAGHAGLLENLFSFKSIQNQPFLIGGAVALSPSIGLDLLEQGQGQKEITINEALVRLDMLAGASAKDKDLATPPSSPNPGDVYIVGASSTGSWAGKSGMIAAYYQQWWFTQPHEGWTLWVQDEDASYRYNGATWGMAGSGGGASAVTSAAFSGTHTGASSFSGVQNFLSGIQLGNTAQSGATTLDWYEEGTFTPSWSSSGATFSHAAQQGNYIKIGQMVFGTVRLVASATGTLTNQLVLGGLPFTATSLSSPGNAQLMYSTGSTAFFVFVDVSSSSGRCFAIGGSSNVTPSQIGLSTTREIILNFSYRAAA